MKHHRISAQVPMAHLFLVHVLHGFQDLKGRKGAGLDTQQIVDSGGHGSEKINLAVPTEYHEIDGEIIGVTVLAMAMYWKCYETKQQNLNYLKLCVVLCVWIFHQYRDIFPDIFQQDLVRVAWTQSSHSPA